MHVSVYPARTYPHARIADLDFPKAGARPPPGWASPDWLHEGNVVEDR